LEDIYLKAPELSNKIVNIIDLCAKKIASNNVKNIKLLASEGTILSKIYHNVFSEYKIEIEEVDDSDFQRMRNWIEAVKQQKIDEQILMDFVDYINNSESNDVVLGCTELPVLYDKCSDKIIKNIYDPLDCAVEFLKLKQNDRIK
jgi:aspartate racemase